MYSTHVHIRDAPMYWQPILDSMKKADTDGLLGTFDLRDVKKHRCKVALNSLLIQTVL